jgi:hypothetical protein
VLHEQREAPPLLVLRDAQSVDEGGQHTLKHILGHRERGEKEVEERGSRRVDKSRRVKSLATDDRTLASHTRGLQEFPPLAIRMEIHDSLSSAASPVDATNHHTIQADERHEVVKRR